MHPFQIASLSKEEVQGSFHMVSLGMLLRDVVYLMKTYIGFD